MSVRPVSFLGSEKNNLAGDLYGDENSNISQIILFLHGGGQTKHSWESTALRLSHNQGFLCYTIDARGHGESDWVKSQNYSLPDYAQDLVCLSEQIKSKYGIPPIVVGASLGGMSAMLSLSGDHKNLFSALILVDITPHPDDSGVEKIHDFMVEHMQDGFASIEDASRSISDYLPNRPAPKSLDGLSHNLRKVGDRYYWHWDPAFWLGSKPINTNEESNEPLMWLGCSKIDFPCLLIRGKRSELVLQSSVDEFRQKVPNSEFIDIADAGHMVAGDKNDIFADALESFLLHNFT